MYLLDTNIISYWMRGDRSVIERIRKHAPANLFLSTVTLAEILYGIEKSSVKKNMTKKALINDITGLEQTKGPCVKNTVFYNLNELQFYRIKKENHSWK